MIKSPPYTSIAVLGGGAWGTALANLTARNGIETILWAKEPSVAHEINHNHENKVYLKGAALAPALRATNDLGEAAQREAIIFVVPAQFGRSVLTELQAFSPGAKPVLLCSKGIEQKSQCFMTQVLAQTWPDATPAVLSGPSFAHDVAQGLPTAVTIAAESEEMGARWAASVGASHFRPYLSSDLIGAELGGAVKNVLAIAAGAVMGQRLGESARAALITRGFAEFQRLGAALGAELQTMVGLSGLGDLILTASSPQSRNMSLGVELGKGRALGEILGERKSVSEGAASAEALLAIAAQNRIEMPICEAVVDILREEKTVKDVIADLLARPLKSER